MAVGLHPKKLPVTNLDKKKQESSKRKLRPWQSLDEHEEQESEDLLDRILNRPDKRKIPRECPEVMLSNLEERIQKRASEIFKNLDDLTS